MTMRYLAALFGVLMTFGAARAQLKDVDFRPAPEKPEVFTDKNLFVVPTAAPVVKPDAPVWTGGVEFGLNGTDGNTEVLKVRLGSNVKRQVENNILTADLVYGLARQMGVTSENKALFNARDEAFFRGSPWGLFAAAQVEYDEFRAFDFRVASHGGFAYQFLRTELSSFRGRLGAGASREVGGPNDRWVPEGLVGFDLDYRVAARQRLIAAADFYPDLGRTDRYRVRARAAYEIGLDDRNCLTLRFGIQDRYDSNPGNSVRNDVDYFTTLLFKF